ncbi:MAG: UMP kinase [Clostridia bacterium]|nr:UMP kinase [Clostridia bacterium]
MQTPAYKRVLLKLSGEALKNDADTILDFDYIDTVVSEIKRCVQAGVQVALVIGAGNIWRGARGTDVNRTRADHMGMLATVINSIGMKDALLRAGIDAHVMTPVSMDTFAEPYLRDRAVEYLEKGSVVILACGSGAPFFSTDTAAVLRAAELNCDVTLMAKNIDAVYTADPRKDPDAKRLAEIDYMYILDNHLTAIDITATAFSMENKMPIHIFGLSDPANIYKVIMGEKLGTIVKEA